MPAPAALPEDPADRRFAATPYRVIYADTDLAGHMYYGNYMRLFEIGRAELLRRAGATYRMWEEEHGVMLPVREAHAEYFAPAKYDDLVAIKTWLAEVTAVSVRFAYRIERDGLLLVAGHTVHPCVDLKTRRPVRRLRELMEPAGLWR